MAAKKKAVSAVETPPPPKAPFNPAWISAGCAVLTFVGLVITLLASPFRTVDTKLDTTNERLGSIDKTLVAQAKDLSVLQNWARKHDQTFPGGHVQSPEPAPSASVTDADPGPAPSGKGARGFPSSIAPISAPQCVSSKTFHRMPCEQAAEKSCRGLNAFAPERYRQIRVKAGVGEYMLVCDEK